MRCSASAMFASSNVDSCQARIRRSIYSMRGRLDVSFNLITHSVINTDVHVASKLNKQPKRMRPDTDYDACLICQKGAYSHSRLMQKLTDQGYPALLYAMNLN